MALTKRRRLGTLVVTVVAVVATACAESPPPPGTDVSPTPEPPPTVTSPEVPPTPGDELVRATGTVVKGTEPGCLLLDTGERRYLLLGGDRDRLEPKKRVTVTGVADPGAPTTCMEGIPLTVARIGD